MSHRPTANRFVQRSGFTLIELLVAVSVLVLIMSFLLSVVQISTKTWVQERAQASNFAEGRAVMDLIARDINQSVLRLDLPAFVNETGAPTLRFLTRNLAEEDGRGVSLIDYRVDNTNVNLALRGIYRNSESYGFAQSLPFGQNSLSLSSNSQSGVAGPGVLFLHYHFVDAQGQVTNAYVPPTSDGLSASTSQAVVISMLVIDGENLERLQSSGQLEPLLIDMAITSLPASESYVEEWNQRLSTLIANQTLSAPLAASLRTYERSIPLNYERF